MLTMADSVTVADLPMGMDAYAQYVDGGWPDYAQMVARFPDALHLSITTRRAADMQADALDVEPLDAWPPGPEIPAFILGRAGLRVVYVARDNVALVMGVAELPPRSRWKLWTAHYGFGEHICGPTTCGLEWQADGTQWTDTGPYDLSILLDTFFTVSQEVDMPTFVRDPKSGMICECSGGVATDLGDDWPKFRLAFPSAPLIEDTNGTILGQRYVVKGQQVG